MRQIKFRLWDSKNNCWYEPTFEAYRGKVEEVMISPRGRLTMRTMTELIDESMFPNRFELMEYTGLHDKNGRDVYEGDIVHVWDNGVAVVIFDESLGRGQWMCKFKPAFPDWDEWSAPLYGWLEGNVDGSVFEILGNVYENPELMEVAEHER